MKRLIIGGLAALAAAMTLTACGGKEAPPIATTTVAATPTSTPVTAPAPVAVPVSALAPHLTLPAGSKEDDPTKYPEMEYWRVPTPYNVTVQQLQPQLPVNQDYDGLAWCTQSVNTKLNITQWSGGGAGSDTLVVTANDDGTVVIDRRLDESDDRSDCDAGSTAAARPQDDQFIAALDAMKGWPDRAQVIAAKRDDLIEMGQDACAIQKQDGEGSIATSARVMDIYDIPGDEAGAITAAAFDVYCPGAGS